MTRKSQTYRLSSRGLATPILFCAIVVTQTVLPGSADAQPQESQVSYPCKYAPLGYEHLARSDAIATTVAINAPASISPGQTVALTGTVSMQMPEAFATLAAEYSKEAELTIADMELPVTVAGQSSTVRVSRVQSGKVPTKTNPLALRGSVTLSDIVVPADATGEIRVGMPTTGSATSKIDSTPVAFNASLTVTGGTVDPYRTVDATLSCGSPPNDTRPVAVISIAANPAAAAVSNSVQPNHGGAAPAPAPSDGDPATPAPLATAAAPNPSAVIDQPVSSNNAAAVIPLNYRTDGVFVPGWWVLSVVVLGGVLTTGFAAWTYSRFRRLRHQLEN